METGQRFACDGGRQARSDGLDLAPETLAGRRALARLAET